MFKFKIPKKILDKRIPTLAGMGILIISLVAGTLLIGQGGGVFSPRASVETTPKNIKVTNVFDTSFTISFLTDEETPGFVKYGTAENSLKSQAGDDRDQISGTVGSFKLHHITVRGLQENTTYFYALGTGSGNIFNDNGAPFRIKTASRSGAPAAAKTIYGSVSTETGAPAEGSIVYVDVNRAGPMSSQVKSSGSWAIPLSNARTTDGSAYALIVDTDNIIINVQGPLFSQTASLTTTVADSQPVASITFGQNSAAVVNTPDLPTTSEVPLASEIKETQTEATPNPDETQESQTNEQNEAQTEAQTEATPNPDETQESQTNEQNEAQTEAQTEATPNPDETQESQTSPNTDYPNNQTGSESNQTNETPSARTAMLDELATNLTPDYVASKTELDLDATQHQTVTTANPKIFGTAPANVTVSIKINSNTQINQTVIVDELGNFVLDIASLPESLEPGEHTITYSYVDPDTNETIEKTVNFTVADTSNQLALATTPTPTPYGSGNPYPVQSPLISPNPATQSAQATESGQATESARTSQPATGEGVPVSGSVGTTLALVFGGLFFIISGLWSFWISTELDKRELEI